MGFSIVIFVASFLAAIVAEWFSIVGIVSLYTGAPFNAGLILGVVLGIGKLVNTSFLYRYWKSTSWALKLPLLYFQVALMVITSIGVFGFLTKSHLEQSIQNSNNSTQIEIINSKINIEKQTIVDKEKIISQLDAAVDSYIKKDKTDRAVYIRKTQTTQRALLRNEIDKAQNKIGALNEEKYTLEAETKSRQLETGPIMYIVELFGNKIDVDTAIKIFTLLIVSTLDPFAIILLIAANHVLMRHKGSKVEPTVIEEPEPTIEQPTEPKNEENVIINSVYDVYYDGINKKSEQIDKSSHGVSWVNRFRGK